MLYNHYYDKRMNMKISSSFECGNGKNITKAGNNYRVEVDGDSPDYEDYFCIRVQGEEETAAIEIVPDPKITKDYDIAYSWPGKNTHIWLYSQMASNLILIDLAFFDPKGSPIWFRREGGSWHTLPSESYDTSGGTIKIKITLNREETIYLSSFVPLPYSEMSCWLKEVETVHSDILTLDSIGRSVRGREIWLLGMAGRKNGTAEKNPIFISSGCHPAEFPGVWAVKGIIEYLVSGDAVAKWILDNYIVYAIPQMNPDGNVSGRCQFNAEGQDVSTSFGKVVGEECRCWRCSGSEDKPPAHEAKIIWDFAKKIRPYLYVDFHGWRTCIFGHEPFEGAGTFDERVYTDEGKRAAKRILDREIETRTHGTSLFGRLFDASEKTVHMLGHQLTKNFNTLSYSYEPNMRIGVDGCMKRGVQVLKVLLNGIEIYNRR